MQRSEKTQYRAVYTVSRPPVQCRPDTLRLQLELRGFPQPALLPGPTGAEGAPSDVLLHRRCYMSSHTNTFACVEAGVDPPSAGCEGGSRRRGRTWLCCIHSERLQLSTLKYNQPQSFHTTQQHVIKTHVTFFPLCFFYFLP